MEWVFGWGMGIMGGMFDFTGTQFNFTVGEKVIEVVALDFSRKADGSAFDLSNATFAARLFDRAGVEVEGFMVQHDKVALNRLVLFVPGLLAGEYVYEVVATSDTLEQEIVMRGVLTAISRAGADEVMAAADKAVMRGLTLHVPEVVGAALEAEWKGTSIAGLYAANAQASAQEAERAEEEAKKAQEEAKKSAGEVEEKIEGALDGVVEDAKRVVQEVIDRTREELEGLTERAERAAASAESIRDKVDWMSALMDELFEHIRSAIVINPDTNTFWIGGVDTGYQATGDPGKSPRVSDHNTWLLYNLDTKEWDDTGLQVEGKDGKSPYIDSEGYWVDVDPATGAYRRTNVRALGRDGVDGTSVVRHVVDSVEDIPSEGDTCSGGHCYYVPLHDALPVLTLEVREEGRTDADVLVINGVELELPEAGLGAEEAAGMLAGVLAGVFAEADVWVDGVRVKMRGDVDAWVLGAPFPTAGYGVMQDVRMHKEGYDVYHWCEVGGVGQWIRCGEVNDLATHEVYGMVKLGTDVPVENGAPVGNDQDGCLRVPYAEWLLPGVVLPGVDYTVEEGGAVGFDGDGRMFAVRANSATYGVVMTSYTGTGALTATVGIMEDGRLGIPWATHTQAGVIKLGSEWGQVNPIPYRLAVGATQDHQLVNNLLYNGAIQHMQRADWITKVEMDDLILEIPGEFLQGSNMYYLGLVTSAQFTQTAKTGLELRSAANDLLAGVYVARSLDKDTRENAVPSAVMVYKYLEGKYYTREELYTRKESDERYAPKEQGEDLDKRLGVCEKEHAQLLKDHEAIRSEHESMKARVDGYENEIRGVARDEVQALLDNPGSGLGELKSELRSIYSKLDSLSNDYVLKTDTWDGVNVLTQKSYDSLTSYDSKKLYVIVGEEVLR